MRHGGGRDDGPRSWAMQRRLLISMLAVAVVAVALLGVPLAFAISRIAGQRGQSAAAPGRRDPGPRPAGTDGRGLPGRRGQIGQLPAGPLRDHPAEQAGRSPGRAPPRLRTTRSRRDLDDRLHGDRRGRRLATSPARSTSGLLLIGALGAAGHRRRGGAGPAAGTPTDPAAGGAGRSGGPAGLRRCPPARPPVRGAGA